MQVGIKLGSRGGEVKRLQRALTAVGSTVDLRERAAEEFGPSTLAALHDLQRKRGIALTDEIDQATLAVLFELKQSITIKIQGGAEANAAALSTGRVIGRLVNGDGEALAKEPCRNNLTTGREWMALDLECAA